ncbi:hypothetical protein [Methanoculleus sp.]|jgi:uncharacterized protein YqeY|uniref:hypothetical protein n=1 Tax=Methanoculleus sp. TaxID=90427 RepID=UPI001BD46F5B|nr:hypothetical protein [Methanoculleus sp.]
MAGNLEINHLIEEAIYDHSSNEFVVQLILDSLQYELDIWNRYLPRSEIESQYELIVDRIVKEMAE